MKKTNTFGVHLTIRQNKMQNSKRPVYLYSADITLTVI